MLKHFIPTFYPEYSDDEDYITEADMAGYRIQFAHGTKLYKSDEKTLAVWRLEEVKKKLRIGRARDPYLSKASEDMGNWIEEKKASGDKMTIEHAIDCEKVWTKAFNFVLEEPPPEPLTPCEWFGEPAHEEGESCEQPKEEKKSLFRKKK